MTKLNSSNIIKIRKQICDTKTKYWGIIRSENKMSKKAKASGKGSGFDLKALYNQITQMKDKLVIIKGMLACFNTGIKFDLDEFKKSNNYAIFMACELKEIKAQLKMIPTINPNKKAKKGLKGIGETETFTSAKIAQLIKDIDLEINKYDASLEKFNNDTTIELNDELTDTFKEYLTA